MLRGVDAYFVGRVELLKWVNEFLSLKLTKVEECANGAVQCQVFDAIFPGKVPLRKVKFNARQEYEFIANYKILQDVFLKCSVNKVIPVERLIKAKYQDNLEFLQWTYEFFNRNYQGQPYDAKARRRGVKHKSTGQKQATASAAPGARSKAPLQKPMRQKAPGTPPSAVISESEIQKRVDKQVEGMRSELEEMKALAMEIEKERDFYFDKIVKVEDICKEQEESEFINAVLEVLYADPAEEVQ